MNWPSVLTLLIVLILIAAVLFVLLRNRKKGKSSCGCGTCHESCPYGKNCHPAQDKSTQENH